MPRTKPALHPIVDTIDLDNLAQPLADVILVSKRRIAKELTRSTEALELPASNLHRGQLCIVASQAELRVALRSSMPSDEELSHDVDDYRFWSDCRPGSTKASLEDCRPAAIKILALLQCWVRAVNRMIASHRVRLRSIALPTISVPKPPPLWSASQRRRQAHAPLVWHRIHSQGDEPSMLASRCGKSMIGCRQLISICRKLFRVVTHDCL